MIPHRGLVVSLLGCGADARPVSGRDILTGRRWSVAAPASGQATVLSGCRSLGEQVAHRTRLAPE
jgi:hypothetical protein